MASGTSKPSIRAKKARRDFAPIHPGEILREEFLIPMDLSQYRLAQSIRVHPRRVNEIVHEKRSISADTALRLAKFFGTSVEFWTNLQARYDTEVAREAARDLDLIQPLRAAG
jgi:addiction module HigA family antidote